MITLKVQRLVAYYLNYPDEFSVLHNVFGYDVPPRTLSLRERLRYLESFANLRVMLIQKWIDDWQNNDRAFGLSESERQGLTDKTELDSKESGAMSKFSFRRIAAGLMALKDIERFDEAYTIKDTPLANPNSNEYFPKQVEQWAISDSGFRAIGKTGSADPNPYDFVMKEIVSLLYVFRDHRGKDLEHLLTDATCFALIDRGFREKGLLNESFGKHLTYRVIVPEKYWAVAFLIAGDPIAIAAVAAELKNLYYPETENHLLMSYSSIYLARQWVKQNPRNESKFKKPRYSNIDDEDLDDKIVNLLLEASGRVLHNGFFETNGRPYRAFSAHPLQCLHSFADHKCPDHKRLRAAAGNALNFAWTSCAFQSYFQRTYGPFRRNNEKANDVSNYDTGNIAMVAPFFAPPIPDPQVTPPLPDRTVFDDNFWNNNMSNTAGFTLWAMLLSYRPHEVITDFAIKDNLFNAEMGYWARMQPRYTKDHYKKGDPPRYFQSDGSPFGAGSNIESTPELFFVQKEFMNAGGGRFNRYKIKYDDILALRESNPGGTQEYDFIARPQVAFVERAMQEFKDLGTMRNKVMFMLGEEGSDKRKHKHGFWLSDNSGIYKGFSYGYFKERDSTDRHLDFPMSTPEAWLAFRYEEGGKHVFQNSGNSRVAFTFFDLEVDNKPGPYVITARVSKNKNRKRYRDYARGFWELVPRTGRFDSVEALKTWVLQHNPDEHFSNDTDGARRFYIYTMTTGESLQLNDLLGYDKKPNKKTNSIRNIWASGSTPLVDAPLKLSDFVVNHHNASDVKAMPLLQVREVNNQSAFTNRVYAIAKGDGRLKVTNPYMNYELTFDSHDYENPAQGGRKIV